MAKLVGAVLVVPTLTVPLWSWWRGSTVPAAVTSEDVA
jgi:hypothetical protein